MKQTQNSVVIIQNPLELLNVIDSKLNHSSTLTTIDLSNNEHTVGLKMK